MNYEEALDYIHNVNRSFCKPGLERVEALCRHLGNPERELTCIHVAGTNGKGSFCSMTESILRAAGYKTGLYTSPYIKRFNERMQVNGECISDEELVELTELLRPAVESMEDKPTEFELITAIAFAYFRRHNVDVVVLEVGLGGRLDSTNVIRNPLLSVVTGIDFDHTDLLGNTLQAIAAEKGGIIKDGAPVLYGSTASSALGVISALASMRHSRLYSTDRSLLKVKSYSLDGTVFDFGDRHDLKLPLLGTYQPYNAATVLTAVDILNETSSLRISEDAIRRGLETVRWGARFEKLSDSPVVIYDGSHNPQGARSAVRSIEEYFPEGQVNLLTGVMGDKDYDEIIEIMKPVAHFAYTVTPANPRALDAHLYAAHFRRHGIPAQGFDTVAEGVRAALNASRAEGRPLVCLGSLYLYGELSDAVARELG